LPGGHGSCWIHETGFWSQEINPPSGVVAVPVKGELIKKKGTIFPLKKGNKRDCNNGVISSINNPLTPFVKGGFVLFN
jgi:hypothetical protein